MTTNEIKAAWNNFKKAAKKEMSFDMTGCCYANARQIANGTATIHLCCDKEYDAEIACLRATIEKVNGYTSWTPEEKKRSEARSLEAIAEHEARKAAYGTRANEAKTKTAEITSSAAFKKLAQAINIQHFEVELAKKWEGLNAYQIRIHF